MSDRVIATSMALTEAFNEWRIGTCRYECRLCGESAAVFANSGAFWTHVERHHRTRGRIYQSAFGNGLLTSQDDDGDDQSHACQIPDCGDVLRYDEAKIKRHLRKKHAPMTLSDYFVNYLWPELAREKRKRNCRQTAEAKCVSLSVSEDNDNDNLDIKTEVEEDETFLETEEVVEDDDGIPLPPALPRIRDVSPDVSEVKKLYCNSRKRLYNACKFICGVEDCNANCKNSSELVAHVKGRHGSLDWDPTEDDLKAMAVKKTYHKCQVVNCGREVLLDRRVLGRHLSTHHGGLTWDEYKGGKNESPKKMKKSPGVVTGAGAHAGAFAGATPKRNKPMPKSVKNKKMKRFHQQLEIKEETGVDPLNWYDGTLYKCHLCEDKFEVRNKNEMKYHLRSVHETTNVSNDEVASNCLVSESAYRCKICGLDAIRKERKSIHQHLLKQHGVTIDQYEELHEKPPQVDLNANEELNVSAVNVMTVDNPDPLEVAGSVSTGSFSKCV